MVSFRGTRVPSRFKDCNYLPFLHVLSMILFFMQLFSRLRTHSRSVDTRWRIDPGSMSSIPYACLVRFKAFCVLFHQQRMVHRGARMMKFPQLVAGFVG